MIGITTLRQGSSLTALGLLVAAALAILSAPTAGADPTFYPRPKGASPLTVPLVPAYAPCTSPNRTHGAPFGFGSCAPPHQISSGSTVGTADSNGLQANFIGSVTFKVVPGDPAFGRPPDLRITADLRAVYDPSDLGPYRHALRLVTTVRLTDRRNGPSGNETGTVQDFDLAVPVDCLYDRRAPELGANCMAGITLNTLIPGAVTNVNRAIWEVGQVRIYDAGADGNEGTSADNQLFVTQGVFVP